MSSTWTDGFKDDLVFTTDRMTGWDIAVTETLVINEWECFRADQFESDGYLEMKYEYTYDKFQRSIYF